MVAIRTFSNLRFLALLVSLALTPGPAAAADLPPAGEAARHFDRGYSLAQKGNLEAAISEFERAYALSPHPSVLYNLGQAYAASGRAVQAVRTLRRYLEQADSAREAERRAQAAAIISYQEERIGALVLEVEPPDAELTLDGEPIGRAPLAGPLPLTAGSHGLMVTHGGYIPRSLRVDIAGKASTTARVSLERTGVPARIAVTCSVPDVTVTGEGVASRRLELGGELFVTTRPRELRFERPGFVPMLRVVPPDPNVAVDCGLDAFEQGATLVPVVIDAPQATVVNVNGRPFRRGKLPLGRHRVTFSGGNVELIERWLEVGGAPRRFMVEAREPGSALASERSSRRRMQLTLAAATAAAGVVSLGAAGILHAVNQGSYSDWREDGRMLAHRMTTEPDQVSAGEWNRLLERENALRNRDAAALGLTIAGGLLLTSGLALWLSAPRPATSAFTLHIGKSSFIGYSTAF